MPVLVLKFGGTSVLKSPNQILKIIKKKSKNNKVFIVLSALSGVTNLLHKLYLANSSIDKVRLIKKVKKVHYKFVKKVKSNNLVLLRYSLNVLFYNLESIVFRTKKKTLKYKNILVTYGEKLSVLIYSELLKKVNLDNNLVWSEFLIKTNNNYREAFPLLDKSADCFKKCKRLLNKDIVITTGYVTESIEGFKTTLGRNGSDFTATIIASIYGANRVEIYSDVDGVLTSDPRKVKNAKLIDTLNYKQISEMCYFGASVLHPKTLIPLKDKNIDLYMKNTFKPRFKGTYITNNYKSIRQIDAITSITDQSLITIKGKGMLGVCGISYKVFKTLVDNDINTSFITQASSEQNLCISVKNSLVNKLQKKLKINLKNELSLGQIDKIRADKNIVIITVIGSNMNNRVGIAGEIFTILGKNNINIFAISQGTSEISISFVLKKEDELKALNCLHEHFI